MTSRPALILLGGLAVAWNQRFLDAARGRGLAVLLIDAPGPHAPAVLASLRAGDGPGGERGAVLDGAMIAPAEVATIVDRGFDWARTFDVRGVCCLREEYVGATATVADLLGLPSPGLRAARVCRDKYLQRRYLAAWSPTSTMVDPAQREQVAAEWNRYPVIVKPTARLASSGVQLVSTAERLPAALTRYEPHEVLLFEERAAGPEYSIESLSHAGKVGYAVVTEKRTSEGSGDYFVELGHTTPAPGLSTAQRDRLVRTHIEILDRLLFDTGIAHAEYRIAPNGGIRLIEIAVRPPGDSIMALHWLANGEPLEDAVVGLAVGESVEAPVPRRYARQAYLAHRPGVLTDLQVDAALGVAPQWFDPGQVSVQVPECGQAADPPALRCVVALKPRGTTLGPVRESGDRAAMFVLDATTPSELAVFEARCRSGISLRVRPDEVS